MEDVGGQDDVAAALGEEGRRAEAEGAAAEGAAAAAEGAAAAAGPSLLPGSAVTSSAANDANGYSLPNVRLP